MWKRSCLGFTSCNGRYGLPERLYGRRVLCNWSLLHGTRRDERLAVANKLNSGYANWKVLEWWRIDWLNRRHSGSEQKWRVLVVGLAQLDGMSVFTSQNPIPTGFESILAPSVVGWINQCWTLFLAGCNSWTLLQRKWRAKLASIWSELNCLSQVQRLSWDAYHVGSVPGNEVILIRAYVSLLRIVLKWVSIVLGERKEMKSERPEVKSERLWWRASQKDIVVINRGLVLLLD